MKRMFQDLRQDHP